MKGFDYAIVRDPEIFQENRLPAHSDHRFYSVDGEYERECRVSLNGVWKFAYAQNYQMAPSGFEQMSYDVTGWDDIRVPGHIQMQGYDHPIYTNIQYPWDGHEKIVPGEIPTRWNPTATYVRSFRVPDYMKGNEIHVSFQGVESGMALWVNGNYIGYSEDSFTPSEFDLTPHLVDGENRMAVQVFKWTAGSWCEDQDFIRFSGIFRDVWLVMIPRIHVRDLRVQTCLDDSFSNAVLQLDLAATAAGNVQISLFDGGDEIFSNEQELSGGNNSYSFPMHNPELWSAEYPKLYELAIEVMDEQGMLIECVEESVGFRRFDIKDSIMYLNGKRIIFHGVNRHEFTADNGRYMTEDVIVKDLVTMKQNNINAIRTSHYPNNSAFYRLCDEYGFYVIGETNLETHGMWDAYLRGKTELEEVVPGNRPEFRELILDRARSMFDRDKNHPSILIWSCGNEAYGGSNIFEMAESFRKWDNTRPVHYEGTFQDRRFNQTSDIESTMYLAADDIRTYLQTHRDKPYISCEYMHAMGNSVGAMDKYTKLIDEEPLYQGGFIWDYIDQSITLKDRYGNEYQGYGGDFGDRPCDYSFCGNGIVYGKDRDPSPKMQEVKFCYQNISIDISETSEADYPDSFRLQIFNRSLFTNTDAYQCEISVARNGELVYTREGSLCVAPEKKTEITMQIAIPEQAGEYCLTVAFVLKEDTIWAQKGHEVAYGQYVFFREGMDDSGQCLPGSDNQNASVREEIDDNRQNVSAGNEMHGSRKSVMKMEVVDCVHNIGVRSEHFEVLFSRIFGGIVSYKYAGKEMLAAIPKPNFWRAPTENDVANQLAFRAGQWKTASMYLSHKYEHGHRETICTVEEKRNSVVVTYTYHLPVRPEMDCSVQYEVFADGTVETTLRMDASDAVGELPAFEMLFTMDADYEQLTWYGLGPDETYLDRQHAKLGIYENKVADNMAKYLVPQECGNKVGVRWAAVTDAHGRGLLFSVGTDGNCAKEAGFANTADASNAANCAKNSKVVNTAKCENSEKSVNTENGVKIPNQGIQFSALPYAPQELENARHLTELPPVHYTTVRIGQQMGVGGDDTWGALVHPEFLLDNTKPMEIRFKFRGIT